eukprot:Nk52_evm5s224 gene=Nk52_evmTU5s224
MTPKFDDQLPPQLMGLVSQRELEKTIERINEIFRVAETVTKGDVCWSMFHCVTGFMFSCCFSGRTRYDLAVDELEEFIDSENEKIYHPKKLHFSSPMNHGMRMIQIYSLPVISARL